MRTSDPGRRALVLVLVALLTVSHPAVAQTPPPDAPPLASSIKLIRENIHKDYRGMFREKGGAFGHPFLAPGSAQYADVLWDWDSWLSNVALRQVLLEVGTDEDRKKALAYERGSVLNFLDYGGMDGWVPIILTRNSPPRRELRKREGVEESNMHKPVLAQHAAFLTQLAGGDAEWLRERFFFLQSFVNRYKNHQRHRATGLYFWNDDTAIGVDNDPATYMRSPRSSGSIYLNAFMFKELQATRVPRGAIEHGRDRGALSARRG